MLGHQVVHPVANLVVLGGLQKLRLLGRVGELLGHHAAGPEQSEGEVHPAGSLVPQLASPGMDRLAADVELDLGHHCSLFSRNRVSFASSVGMCGFSGRACRAAWPIAMTVCV
jgi:hypothetical protein